jgi:acyl-CoA synthetase (AMP-forming)/AMP-acid ligase II
MLTCSPLDRTSRSPDRRGRVRDDSDRLHLRHDRQAKGVMYTHRGAYLNALGEVIHSEHTPESIYLWTLPMFHCNGWCTTWGVTAIGGTHVCLRAVRGDRIWELISSEQVTHLNGAPTVLTTIANDPGAQQLERPLVITTAGAPPNPKRLQGAWRNLIVVHTPVSASWLNQCEIYFSIVQRKALRPNNFADLDELEHHLLAFGRRYEQIAKPFEWKFTRHDLDRVLDRLDQPPPGAPNPASSVTYEYVKTTERQKLPCQRSGLQPPHPIKRRVLAKRTTKDTAFAEPGYLTAAAIPPVKAGPTIARSAPVGPITGPAPPNIQFLRNATTPAGKILVARSISRRRRGGTAARPDRGRARPSIMLRRVNRPPGGPPGALCVGFSCAPGRPR